MLAAILDLVQTTHWVLWLPNAMLLAVPVGSIALISALGAQIGARPACACPHCGYDVRATRQRCPECGTVLRHCVQNAQRAT